MINEEGPGWRLAKDLSRRPFSTLIGGDGWAFELTEDEWDSLVKLVLKLDNQHRQLQNQLLVEESIQMESECELWWVCLEGNRSQWSLRILRQGDLDRIRGIEGFWPVPSAQEIVLAMRKMWDSCQ